MLQQGISSGSSGSSEDGRDDINQLIYKNQARIEEMLSRFSEHVDSQTNVNSMFFKLLEEFQKDLHDFKEHGAVKGDIHTEHRPEALPDDSRFAELKEHLTEDEKTQALKLRRVVQKIETLENRLKDDEHHDEALEKRVAKLKEDAANALDCKTTILSKDVLRLSGNILPMKNRLSNYEKGIKNLIESEKLDVTALAGKFDSLAHDLEALSKSLDGERGETSKRVKALKRSISSIRVHLDKHHDALAEELHSKLNEKIHDFRKELDPVKKALPRIKSKISVHEKMMSRMEVSEKADILHVTEDISALQKSFLSVSKDLDREEKLTVRRIKVLRHTIVSSRADTEKRMKSSVIDILAKIDIINRTIPDMQEMLGSHDRDLKDLIATESLDVQKITAELISLKADVIRLEKKFGDAHKVLVLDLKNRVSKMEVSLNESLKSQSDLVRRNIESVTIHLPHLRNKLSVHERQFRKMMDSQKVSAQKFTGNLEKLSSALESEETVYSSNIHVLKDRIENVNRDLRKMHKEDFNVIDDEVRQNVSSLRGDIEKLSTSIPVMKDRLLKHDSGLADAIKQESFDVRLLAGRLEGLASEIDGIERRQSVHDEMSAKSVAELRDNVLSLVDHLRAESSRKFSLVNQSVKDSVNVIQKEIDAVSSKIPYLRSDLSKYSSELKVLSADEKSDTKDLLDKFSELSSDLVLLSSRVAEDDKASLKKITHLKSRIIEIRNELGAKEKRDVSSLGKGFMDKIGSLKSDVNQLSSDVPELSNKLSSVDSALDRAVRTEGYDVKKLSSTLKNFHEELKDDETKSYAMVDSLSRRIDSVRDSLRADIQVRAKDLAKRISSVESEIPGLEGALKSHARDISMLTEKEVFDTKTLSTRLDGLASELTGFERQAHDNLVEVRFHVRDMNNAMLSNMRRSISLVRSEVKAVDCKIPGISVKLSSVDKSLIELSRREESDISSSLDKLDTLSDTLDFISKQSSASASENAKGIDGLKKHVESLYFSLDSREKTDYDGLAKLVSSRADKLSKDIDSVAFSIPVLKDKLLSMKEKISKLSGTEKVDVMLLKSTLASVAKELSAVDKKVSEDETSSKKDMDALHDKLNNSRSALEKDMKKQAVSLHDLIDSVSSKIPVLKESLDRDRKELEMMLGKEKLDIKGLGALLKSLEAELYQEDVESSKKIDRLKVSIADMRRELFKKHCTDIDHLEEDVKNKMSIVHDEITRVGDFIPGIRQSLSRHEGSLKQIRLNEKTDISSVLSLVDNLNTDVNAVEKGLSVQKADYNKKLKNLRFKIYDVRFDLRSDLRVQGESLQKDITEVSSRFPALEKMLSKHSLGLKSILSKEKIDVSRLGDRVADVLSAVNQASSELQGEEKKSKAYFDKLRDNILSVQKTLMQKQEAGDKDVLLTVKLQGAGLQKEIDRLSSDFPQFKKALSKHSLRLKSILSKEKIDVSKLGDSVADVSAALGHTISELHGEEGKSKAYFEKLWGNIVSVQKTLVQKQEAGDKDVLLTVRLQGESLQKEIDRLSSDFPQFKKALSKHSLRLKSILSKEKIDVSKLGDSVADVSAALGHTISELHGEEGKLRDNFETLRDNISSVQKTLVQKQEAGDKNVQLSLKLQGESLQKEIDRLSSDFPQFKKALSKHSLRLKSILSKEKIDVSKLGDSVADVTAVVGLTISELHGEEGKLRDYFETLRDNISSVQKTLVQKQEVGDKDVQLALKLQGECLQKEIAEITSRFPSIKKTLSKHSLRLNSILSKENTDVSSLRNDMVDVLSAVVKASSEIHAEEKKSRKYFEKLRDNISSVQKTLVQKQEAGDKDVQLSLKLQGESLQKEIAEMSSKFPSIKKTLSKHSLRLKSILSKEKVDVSSLRESVADVLSAVDQANSELSVEEKKSREYFDKLKDSIKSVQKTLVRKQEKGDKNLEGSFEARALSIDKSIETVVSQMVGLKNRFISSDYRIDALRRDLRDKSLDISAVFSRLRDIDAYLDKEAKVSKKGINELKTLISKTKKELIEDSIDNTNGLEKRVEANISYIIKSLVKMSDAIPMVKSKILADAMALEKLSKKEKVDIKQVFDKINVIDKELSLQEAGTLKEIDGIRSVIKTMESEFNSSLKDRVFEIRKEINSVSSKVPVLKKKLAVHDVRLKKVADAGKMDVLDVIEKINLLNSDIDSLSSDFLSQNKISDTALLRLKSYIVDLRKSVRRENLQSESKYNDLLKNHISSVRDEIGAVKSSFPELKYKLSDYEKKLSAISGKQKMSANELLGQVNVINDDLEKFMDKETAKKEIKSVRDKIQDVRSTASESLENDVSSLRNEVGSICESVDQLNKRLSEHDQVKVNTSGIDEVSKKSDDLYSKVAEIESSLGKANGDEGAILERMEAMDKRLKSFEDSYFVKMFSDVPSGKEFYFLSDNYAPTGLVARNMLEFIHLFKSMDASIIGFHMKEGSNDFANWIFDVLGLADVTEKLREINCDYSNIDETRKQMLDVMCEVVPFSVN